MKKRFLLIFLFSFFFLPFMVNAQSYTGRASVGRSAVLDTSSNYYYTDWTLLSDNSLNSVPIPTSQGNYYHMGSEYSFPITLTGDTYFQGTVKVPVVANTIYNYQLMNGLNENDLAFGVHQNWGVYNNIVLIDYNMTWQCQTYAHLGVAHNYCFYVINFKFQLPDAWTGAYNLNFKVLDTTGQRSAYYYDGYDSNGNAIEFPVASQNSGYPSLTPSVSMTSTGGSSGSNDNTEEITNAISDSTDAITDEIRESYENLVNSQEVCSSVQTSNTVNIVNNKGLNSLGEAISSNDFVITQFYSLTDSSIIKVLQPYTTSYSSWYYCFYNSNKEVISCSSIASVSSNQILTIPVGSRFFRSSILKSTNKPFFEISTCQNGNQALYDSLTDPSVNGSLAGQFATNKFIFFNEDSLSGVITAPLNFLRSLTNTCQPVVLNVLGQDVSLPCGTTIFWDRSDVSTFRTFWNILFGGVIIYRMTLLLFKTVNDSIDPTKDKVGGLTV